MTPRLAICLAVALAFALPPSALAGNPFDRESPGGQAKPPFEPEPAPVRVQKALGGDVEVAPDGLYRVDVGRGPDVYTHGPDPVTRAFSGGRAPAGDPFGHTKFGGEATDPPVCAASETGDYYQHVIYMRKSTTPDHLDQALANDIFEEIAQMNFALNRDSVASGGPSADYKVLCNDQNQMIITRVVSNATANFSGVTSALRNLGFNKQNVDYTVFYDGDPTVPQCGVGGFFSDESPSANNLNNLGNNHGITWVDCWDGTTPMHENGHNQGAVGYGAPHSTGNGAHCFDAQDIMCYNDGGDLDPGPPLSACANPPPAGQLDRFDCGFDTYFDSAVEVNEPYLDDHWNIGSAVNRFIAFGGGGGGNEPPIAAFTFDCDDLECQFTDQSTDDAGIDTWHWNFGDGGLANSQQNPSHTFPFAGTFNVSLLVEDEDAASDSVQIPVSVGDGTVPKLQNGVAEVASSGAQDTFDRYKFRVPRSARRVTIKLNGEGCDFVSEDLCIPDLDLYIRIGAPPNLEAFDCRPFLYGITEKCVGRAPGIRGTHHIGVYNFAAPPGTDYSIRARFRG